MTAEAVVTRTAVRRPRRPAATAAAELAAVIGAATDQATGWCYALDRELAAATGVVSTHPRSSSVQRALAALITA